MAHRIFLHVGTPKSGTTFLQSVWWAHRDALRDQGLLLPGPGIQEHFHASCVVRDNKRLLSTIPASGHGAWDRVLEATAAWDRDVLVSHELFSPADAERAAGALDQLRAVAAEVHLVLTARDLARQLPAEWQQRTKHGRSEPLRDFLDAVQDGTATTFWRVQDVPAVLDRWGAGVPAERQHLLVLPAPGGPRSWLWDSVCALTGVDGSGMDAPATSGNESLGLAQAETMRRVSARLGQDGLDKSTERLLKGFVAEEMMRSGDPERIVLPADVWPWARDRARQTVAVLEGRGLDVVGDLADLVPAADPVMGRQPEDVTDDEVAATAVEALSRFVRHEQARRTARGARAAERAQDPTGTTPSVTPSVTRPRLLGRLRGRAGRLARRLRSTTVGPGPTPGPAPAPKPAASTAAPGAGEDGTAPTRRRGRRRHRPEDHRYVFVVTYGRSGSTLVQGLLNALPRTLVRGENGLYVLPLYRGMAEALAFRDRHGEHGGRTAASAFFGVRKIRPEPFHRALNDVVCAGLLGAQDRDALDVLGFKEVLWHRIGAEEEAGFFDAMDAAFPGARYVLNTRSAAAVVGSGFWKRVEQDEAGQLIRRVEEIQANLRRTRPDRVFDVQYEVLTGDDAGARDTQMRGLGEFVTGRPVDDDLLGRLHEVTNVTHGPNPRAQAWSDDDEEEASGA